jgi:hypothetical protein
MNHTLVCCALISAMAAAPALAASSTSSAASNSASSTASSASDSLQTSSGSSTNNVAAGDYTVVEVVALADTPGRVRLTLQAVADPSAAGTVHLVLPQPAFERSRLAAGETVAARVRPYGLEFARADTQQAFFLVLDDTWHRELAPPRAVVM